MNHLAWLGSLGHGSFGDSHARHLGLGIVCVLGTGLCDWVGNSLRRAYLGNDRVASSHLGCGRGHDHDTVAECRQPIRDQICNIEPGRGRRSLPHTSGLRDLR